MKRRLDQLELAILMCGIGLLALALILAVGMPGSGLGLSEPGGVLPDLYLA
ncbi:hypothetical protein Q3H58_003538 [Pseudomonas psychrotolerans]|nr:hypothetical protein [Pseudomonas psychrotolerans]